MDAGQFAETVFFSLTGEGADQTRFRGLVHAFGHFDSETRVGILIRFLQFGQAEFEFALRTACVKNVLSHLSMFMCFYLEASVDAATARRRRVAWKLLAIRLQGTPGVSWLLVNQYATNNEHAAVFISTMVMFFEGASKFALLGELEKHASDVVKRSKHGTLPRTTSFILIYMWRNGCERDAAAAALVDMLGEPDVDESVVVMIADVFLRHQLPLEPGSAAQRALDSVPDAFRESVGGAV